MKRWWRSHSVRVRLTIWYVGAMIVVLGVYVAAVFLFVNRSVSRSLDQQLRHDMYWVAAALSQTPAGSFSLMEPEELDPEAALPWVQVWNGEGTRVLFRNAEALRRAVSESSSVPQPGIVSIATETVPVRVLTQRHVFVANEGAIRDQRVVIQVGRSEEGMRAQLRDLMILLVLGLPIAIAAAGIGGYALASRALAPIERMTEHARTITADRLHDRLPVLNPDDEMGRLAAVFNETLGRLEASFEQMRRFTADVSHQLRTPLTAIRSVGEVGLRGPRDAGAYRGIVGSMLEEADRLATLVDRLLTLSRAETGRRRLQAEAVDLAALAEEVAGHLGVLAEEKRQSIAVERDAAPTAMADRVALRQAVINLVDNAIKFSPVGGHIRMRVAETPAHAVLDVIDTGPGVPADARARIFDRFYRGEGVDAAGTGLGLSIARGAVESVGGHLTLEETGADGSTFRLTVPRAERADSRTPGAVAASARNAQPVSGDGPLSH